ncbi:putative bifunctional diguanylate cyclase/phosphodiesterase [Thioflexithrix psekupsensis]|uniref:cyclic-guanylate-specific phosphodiesterase n=1 Tax=Thioflexithrix psekupsensis TaxID=1570016 RepID=A0A251X3M1_9GAMM|nr:EAL domain-containing protein [Thioflexithrix psekupsensis]OUD11737.1 diguanylate cyclase [Thioflexithrix psekupsensis]
MKDTSIILIVDDEIVSRYTVEVLLESEGYQLIFAESGQEALLKAEQYMPDLMLLDVMMPDMDGFQVCQLLRANPRLAELPVVMVTALDDRESKLRGIEVGADDFMSKPFDRAELRARVRTITRLNRYRRLLETEEHLVYLANYDLLTRLPNRSLLIERLRQAISRANRHQQSLAILVMDLDGFQIINDSLGHEFGDQILSEMAVRLAEVVPQGTTVARLGSDEFALMYESRSLVNEVSNLIQNLLNVISKPIMIDAHDIVITASIGISVYPSDGEEALVLLKNANTAMSRAKLEGKNSYKFFTEEMNKLALERLILENHLRKALSRDELRLFYQPQIDLKSHRIIGVEALLRWQHPELGLVSPDRFIPVAEETSMIIAIGEWVLHTACAQCKQWQEQGLSPIRVAVNVSSRQFQNSDLFTTIENALSATQLKPHYLELEITESMLMEDDLTQKNSSFSMFSQLQKKGIHIAVDDFGTGYSSLSYLKRFPLNTLKIDRSFIKDVCSNADDAAITTAIIAMAHSLQLSVVAEGVEAEAQLDFLKQRHCEMAQGFLFSRAVPAHEIEQLLKKFNH